MFSSPTSSSSSDPAAARAGSSGGAAPAGSAPAAGGAGTTPVPPASGGEGPYDPFALFRDVCCPVEVVLGTGTLTLRRCLGLERGSVVRLAQSAGEDLLVAVNGVRIAQAEVVIIDETIAVRVTHLAGPTGRERRG